jgi:predicted site-specific integrase-resolvase
MSEKKYTVKQIAERTGASIKTVGLWCRKGIFPNAVKESTPIGDFWMIPEEDLKYIPTVIKRGRPKKED